MTIKYGKYEIDKGLFLAPMEDVSDFPFRMICKKLGADVMYSEFISSEALIRDAEKAFKKMTIKPEEHPIGIQIYGNRIEAMVEAAQIAEEKGPDFIDINFGCPVKKVALKGAGSGLLQDIPKMIKMCEAVVRAVELPVTAKTRLGWDADSISIVDIARQMESVGIEALAIHGRTRAQQYKGEADWDWIAKTKQAVNMPIIGNGDIIEPQQAIDYLDKYGVDAVMIGRGAIHNPWIFRDAKAYRKTGVVPPMPSVEERVEILKEHYKHTVEYKGEKRGVREMRKYVSGYLKGLPHISKFRQKIVRIDKLSEVIEMLEMLKANPHIRDLMHEMAEEDSAALNMTCNVESENC
ncbi:MAG: tRNA dihydrouridine synthase DusB [Calditrichaeota bacterium]|nr:MAG: tRNA dihydrouridine synthase DusB [Calditrichota bacterium]MBL1206129.1 tRNA dihydrouridine synthase DusB [Calditrichota bacterium]NOG45954.1 tRNA dihydrouridine synthase DusB [Calditrichota bacterium]